MRLLADIGVEFVVKENAYVLVQEDVTVPPFKFFQQVLVRLRGRVRLVAYNAWKELSLQGETIRALPIDDLAPKAANCPWMRTPHLFKPE